jgi:hypothetical protein
MLAAGGGYTGDNISTEGILSMMILDEFGFRRAQTFALEHLMAFHCTSGDLRWTLVALAARSFNPVRAFAQEQFVRLVRNVMRRAWRGARFASGLTAADTMVAAGGG